MKPAGRLRFLSFSILIILKFIYLQSVTCRKNGAPCSAVESMIPQHGVDVEESQDSAFDSLKLKFSHEEKEINCYNANTTIKIQIGSLDSKILSFKGFLIQARKENKIRRVGNFLRSQYGRTQCDEIAAITHNSIQEKPLNTFFVSWKPSELYSGDVHFEVAIVVNKTTWRSNIDESNNRLQFKENCHPITTATSTTTTSTATSTSTTTTTTTTVTSFDGEFLPSANFTDKTVGQSLNLSYLYFNVDNQSWANIRSPHSLCKNYCQFNITNGGRYDAQMGFVTLKTVSESDSYLRYPSISVKKGSVVIRNSQMLMNGGGLQVSGSNKKLEVIDSIINTTKTSIIIGLQTGSTIDNDIASVTLKDVVFTATPFSPTATFGSIKAKGQANITFKGCNITLDRVEHFAVNSVNSKIILEDQVSILLNAGTTSFIGTPTRNDAPTAQAPALLLLKRGSAIITEGDSGRAQVFVAKNGTLIFEENVTLKLIMPAMLRVDTNCSLVIRRSLLINGAQLKVKNSRRCKILKSSETNTPSINNNINIEHANLTIIAGLNGNYELECS